MKIQDAIATRIKELGVAPYSVAADAGVPADTVYALIKGRGASIENLNAILTVLELVAVPSALAKTKARQLGYVEGSTC
jgi:predicted transcriptional regulator